MFYISTFFTMMMPKRLVGSVLMSKVSLPSPSMMLYVISALSPMSLSFAQIRPTTEPTGADSGTLIWYSPEEINKWADWSSCPASPIRLTVLHPLEGAKPPLQPPWLLSLKLTSAWNKWLHKRLTIGLYTVPRAGFNFIHRLTSKKRWQLPNLWRSLQSKLKCLHIVLDGGESLKLFTTDQSSIEVMALIGGGLVMEEGSGGWLFFFV